MANYKPIVKTIGAASADSGTIIPVKLSTTSWGLVLVRGTALFSNVLLKSGAIDVWESTKPTTDTPTRQTFTDTNGIFGITCRANVQLRLKFYNK
jgi:hypothetical protein